MRRIPAYSGFTLVELTVVMFIVALLVSGVMLSLTTQEDLRARRVTQEKLDMAREALIGFAIANGRLPCPARETLGTGQESLNGDECAAVDPGNPLEPLLLPAMTLGIGPVDDQGFLLDGWGHRIRYEVTRWTAPAAFGNAMVFPHRDSTRQLRAYIAQYGLDANASTPRPNPNLEICTVAACGAGNIIADNSVAVLYSTGKNDFGSADESENTDNDNVFVTRAAGPDYDDNVIWISPFTLYSRMFAAGTL